MSDDVANAALTLDMIPSPDASWDEIQAFALSFDGYEHWGSFNRCAEIANSRNPQNLSEHRTCLFFEQRRWRHMGADPTQSDMQYIRSLLDGMCRLVRAGESE